MNKYVEAFEKVKEACASFDTVDELITLKELVDKSTKFVWTSVNDRVPTDNRKLMYVTEYGDVFIGHYDCDNGLWIDCYDDVVEVDVLTWMELPKPYRGE